MKPEIEPEVIVYTGEALASYGFGHGHPFGPQRHNAFVEEFTKQHLDEKVSHGIPVVAEQEAIERFHTHEYVEKVKRLSVSGEGFLDCGDTPAFKGVYEAAGTVVGSVLKALDQLVKGEYKRAFVPIAGLHHARRDSAAGFCVFNDCGVAIETLRQKYNIQRVAYVDIDAHHGDGVFYAFEADPDLIFVDIHEDGQFLYPGTGSVTETGKGNAAGTKLNIPMPSESGDEQFFRVWKQVEEFVRKAEPEFILLQCGADSLKGDPITHMHYSAAAHAHAAQSLCKIANRFCNGRILAMGGGGYTLENLANAWCSVIKEFIEATDE